ncbi:MAG: hypothetical protein JXB00_15635 [Bacteroidales bacterium]|nr:hypothetical protein [Bacteroidales bacterium]
MQGFSSIKQLNFKNILFNSKTVVIVLICIVLIRNLDLGYWKSTNKIIIWDVISYYAYLPATFIHQDPSLGFLKDTKEDFSNKFWPVVSPTGKPVIMMSMGMSMLYSPFFFMAHLYTTHSQHKADGFSPPYRFFLILSCIFYLGLGLVFLRKLLLEFLEDLTVSIVLLVIVLGTNIWYYSTIEPTMTHTYLFGLITLFTYLTHQWYRKPRIFISVILGFIAGLISLIRPTNVIIVVIFLFWGIKSFRDFKTRFLLYFKKLHLIVIILFAAFAIWVPQMLYWKMQAGQYLYYSYGDTNRFFFNNPQIIKSVFSYRKGWLLYTPLMSLAIFGLYFLWKKNREYSLAITLYFIIHLYIISSWWCWWYGGSFGNRAMIDTYGVLAFPMGMCIEAVRKLKKRIKIPVITAIYFFIAFSIFNTMQAKRTIIHWDSMSKKAYWSVFLRYKLPDNYIELLEIPDYEKARQGIHALEKKVNEVTD